jgi:hypothetical protein
MSSLIEMIGVIDSPLGRNVDNEDDLALELIKCVLALGGSSLRIPAKVSDAQQLAL